MPKTPEKFCLRRKTYLLHFRWVMRACYYFLLLLHLHLHSGRFLVRGLMSKVLTSPKECIPVLDLPLPFVALSGEFSATRCKERMTGPGISSQALKFLYAPKTILLRVYRRDIFSRTKRGETLGIQNAAPCAQILCHSTDARADRSARTSCIK